MVIASNGAAGVWALAAARRPALAGGRSLWWFTGAAQVAVFLQVVLGVLAQEDGRRAGQFHTFYGFVALVAIGLLYSYRSQLRDRVYLLYGFGSLFVMGLAIRAALLT